MIAVRANSRFRMSNWISHLPQKKKKKKNKHQKTKQQQLQQQTREGSCQRVFGHRSESGFRDWTRFTFIWGPSKTFQRSHWFCAQVICGSARIEEATVHRIAVLLGVRNRVLYTLSKRKSGEGSSSREQHTAAWIITLSLPNHLPCWCYFHLKAVSKRC